MPGDFAPTASWPALHLRADLLRRVRRFFEQRGFLEVDTPLLSADTVIDRHLDPLAAWLPDDVRDPQGGRRLWLQTSPEFCMKRLLAAGAPSLFQITKAFRAGERGPRHNPEFTLLEWYQRGASYREGMALLSELAEATLGRGPARRVTYRQAFLQHAAVDPLRADASRLVAAARRAGLPVPAGFQADDRDGLLDLLLVERVEPQLSSETPTILYDYPASQAALARIRRDDDGSQVAERFELYVDGIELANGYHELLDADELRARNRAVNRLRQADGKPALPETSRLLEAMDRGLPPCTGVALGFDRLVMCAAGEQQIDRVLCFPTERA